MKKRKKQIFAILMIFCMAVCYMPSFSFAAAEGNADNTAITEQTGTQDEGKTDSASKTTDESTTDTPKKVSSKAKLLGAGNGTNYSVKYEYNGSSLPSQVTATLPDDEEYEDGTTVTPKDPSSEDVLVGSDRYTFDGWDANSKTINGADIKFTGTWSVADAVDTGGDDSDEYEDESSYDPNPPQPESYADDGLLTIQSLNQIGGSGTHLVSFDKGYGTGVCCYHTRKHAGVGSKGYIRELTATDAHYEEIKRAMYWGFEKGDGNSDLGHAFSIHIMLSYWMNGNKSLSSGLKSGTSRFASAKKYCKKLYDKGAAPDNFHIYEWVGVGGAASKQILITYKIVNGGYVTLVKSAADTATNYITEAPNNYSLEGAVYELYTDAACTQKAYDINYNYFTLTTDASGKTPSVQVEEGTYYAKEITASKGFLLDSGTAGSTTARSIPVTVTTANTEANPAKINSTDDPTIGKLIKLRKKNENGDYGWRKLLGAQYTLKYYNVDPSTSDVSDLTPTRSWVFETTQKKDEKNNSYAGIDFDSDTPISGDDFYMETVGSKTVGSNEIYYFDDDPATSSEKRVMPIGVYTIEETKAPEGLSRNTTVYYGSVKQDSNGAFAVTRANTNSSDSMTIEIGTENDVVNDEDLQAVKIIINKYDKETEEQKAQGADRENVKGSLAGAVYEVYYDDNDRETPELVGTITTDENGYGELTKRTLGKETYIGTDLRVGNYLVKEITASPGYVIDKYVLNGENTEEITNGKIEVVCGYESDGTPVTKTIKGTYEDGQHLFRTRAEALDASVFEYTVKSEETPHHTYVSKINITDGKELPGATLQVFDSEGNMIEEWVSTDKPHDIVALHDETQGLKDGKYTLREITAPYGYDVAEDIEFKVESGKIANTVVMKDAPIEIKTTATDVETGTHQGTFSKEEKVKDLVKFKNLYAGRTYTFKGTLMDKKTGEALKDANGEPVTAEKDYTVPGEKGTLVSGEVELEFTVDASSFTKETSVVAFERIERDGRELAMHADLEDDDQTIHYGGIVRTIAKDENLVSHNVIGGPGSVIIDTIEYKNLSTKETYVIEGSIYDKTAGKLLGITAKANFKPATVDGTTTLKFTFDGTDLQNHTLVVFEKLSLNGTEIDKHEDPEDKDQTIYVPEIGTKADKAKSNKVTDRVAYKNLVPGQEYVMRGWLVSKSTGKKIDGSDGEVRFTPTQSSGYVDVTLKVKKGTGKLVAFEECYAVKGNVETKVGEHKDITDKDQTVTVEKGSHPKTGEDCMIYLYGGMFGLAALLAVVMRKKTLLKK